MGELNDRQRLFVAEYPKDCNATRAAIRAGYSKKTAYSQGQRLLKNVEVARSIETALEQRIEQAAINADEVLRSLTLIASSDMRDYVEWGPDGVTLRESEGLADDAAFAVAEVSQTTTESGGSIKFKLHDKKAALELLGKYFKLFTERHEHTGAGGGPIRMIEVADDDAGDGETNAS